MPFCQAGRVSTRIPTARLVVAVAVLLEALVVVAYAVYLGVEGLRAPSASRIGDLFLALTTVLIGAGLGLVARAVVQGRRGARAPVLVWQVLQMVVAAPAAFGRQDALMPVWAGVPLVVLCVVAGLGITRHDVLDDDLAAGDDAQR